MPRPSLLLLFAPALAGALSTYENLSPLGDGDYALVVGAVDLALLETFPAAVDGAVRNASSGEVVAYLQRRAADASLLGTLAPSPGLDFLEPDPVLLPGAPAGTFKLRAMSYAAAPLHEGFACLVAGTDLGAAACDTMPRCAGYIEGGCLVSTTPQRNGTASVAGVDFREKQETVAMILWMEDNPAVPALVSAGAFLATLYALASAPAAATLPTP